MSERTSKHGQEVLCVVDQVEGVLLQLLEGKWVYPGLHLLG